MDPNGGVGVRKDEFPVAEERWGDAVGRTLLGWVVSRGGSWERPYVLKGGASPKGEG